LSRNKDNISENWRFFGNAFLEIDFLNDLTFRSHLGLDYSTWYQSSFTSDTEISWPRTSNELLVQSDYQSNTTWYNTLNYNRVFNGQHALNVLLGTELIDSRYRYLSGSREEFFVEDLSYRFLDAGESAQQNSGTGSEWNMFSLFGKITYAFQNRYLADFIIRRDGSSRFSPEYRYGVFPAFSLGWRISKESFLSGTKWIDDLKLRTSWGQMGNQNIDPYNKYSTFSTDIWRSSYDITGSNISIKSGYDSQRFGNPFGRWETTTILDIGFDATLFNGRFSVYFDWFDRKTTDLLVELPLPATQGEGNAPFQNTGEMENKGVEFTFFYNNGFSNSEFQYSLGFNISHYSNKVLRLGENQNMIIPGPSLRQLRYTRTVEGQPFMSYWGKERNGFTNGSESYWNEEGEYVSDIYPGYYNYISQYGEGVGRFKFIDQNGDGVINDKDNTYIGSPHPDFYYGLNAAFEWKGFDFTLFFQGVSGMDMINYVSRWIDFVQFQGNRSVKMYEKSWTPSLGDQAELPVLSFGDWVSSHQANDYFVQSASYLRMRNMMFGYTFLNIKGVDRLRLYFQMLNLFTITKYEGLEPDVASTNQANDFYLGIDQGVYPSAKTFLFGLNFGF
jgi:TonB-linked SusC/RagA family outer membrane protein